MTCPELTRDPAALPADPAALDSLPRADRAMLNDLFEEAWRMRELAPEQHAGAFLRASALLAATAETSSGVYAPSDWEAALLASPGWAARFQSVMDNPKSLMRMYTRRFSESWPISSVAWLRGHGLLRAEYPTRAEAVAARIAAGAPGKPACWPRHLSEPSVPLPDWPHTLAAWTAVRANLFQDPGGTDSEIEVRIVSNAFLSLIYFFKESRLYFEHPSLRPDLFDRTQVLGSL